MVASMMATIVGVFGSLRAADLIDIAFIAVLIYAIFAWLRKKSTRAVGLVAVGIVFLYEVAELLDLHVTHTILQVGLTVFLFSLVLVFQDDLRRVFERIRVTGFRRSKEPVYPLELDEFLLAVENLAHRQLGALIVLRGQESLSVHLHGGIEVHGKVSYPLLLSVFHDDTPGHDGAVILDGGFIEKIGVHLPLSHNPVQLDGVGTRHAAGLGLAERTDALVVVVSEERGTISVAQEGKLGVVEDIDDLRARLEAFWPVQPNSPRRALRRWVTHNAGLKVLSIGLASVLWFAFTHHVDTLEHTFSVPVQYVNVPNTIELSEQRPMVAEATLAGSQRVFERLRPTDLRIRADLSHAGAGAHMLRLDNDHVHGLPNGVTVRDLEPEILQVRAYPMVEKKVPVWVNVTGNPSGPARKVDLTVEPEAVTLWVREDQAHTVERIITEPVHLDRIRDDRAERVGLVLPKYARFAPGGDRQISLTVTYGNGPQEQK